MKLSTSRGSRKPLYEAGATLLATMAYPEDETRRVRFHCAFCRETIRAMAKEEDFAWALQPIRPIYFLNDDKATKYRMKITSWALTG